MPSTGRCRAGLRASCAGWSGAQRGEGKGGMGSAARKRAAFLVLLLLWEAGGEGWGAAWARGKRGLLEGWQTSPREEEEAENNIPTAQPAPGGKSVHGVLERGVWRALPNFPPYSSFLVPRELKICFSQDFLF